MLPWFFSVLAAINLTFYATDPEAWWSFGSGVLCALSAVVSAIQERP